MIRQTGLRIMPAAFLRHHSVGVGDCPALQRHSSAACLYNILAVAGIAAPVTPGGLEVAPAPIRFDLPLFAAYYAACVAYLILAAAEHDALPEFSYAADQAASGEGGMRSAPS